MVDSDKVSRCLLLVLLGLTVALVRAGESHAAAFRHAPFGDGGWRRSFTSLCSLRMPWESWQRDESTERAACPEAPPDTSVRLQTEPDATILACPVLRGPSRRAYKRSSVGVLPCLVCPRLLRVI